MTANRSIALYREEAARQVSGGELPENLEAVKPPLTAEQQEKILVELRAWRELAVEQVLGAFGKNAQDAPGRSQG
jgi:hypothetical protein